MAFYDATLGGLLGSSIASGFVTALLLRRNTRVENGIKAQIEEAKSIVLSQRDWEERSLSELFGPIVMQFGRTKRAFHRWRKQDIFLEAEVIRKSNVAIRDLLPAKGHLIPPEMVDDALQLIEHYDAWLAEFESVRNSVNAKSDQPFVFVGPKGYPFPRTAEDRFRGEFDRLRQKLFPLGSPVK